MATNLWTFSSDRDLVRVETVADVAGLLGPSLAKDLTRNLRALADEAEMRAQGAGRTALPPPPGPAPSKKAEDKRDTLLSAEQAGELLGVSPTFIRRKAKRWARRLGYRTVRYRLADLEKLAAQK